MAVVGPKPRAEFSPVMPECENPPKHIVIYLCPTKGCPNYYAAPDFRPDRADIESVQHHRSQNDGSQVSSYPRIECPFCRAQSKHVNREPYVVTEVVPLKKVQAALAKAEGLKAKAAQKVMAANAGAKQE